MAYVVPAKRKVIHEIPGACPVVGMHFCYTNQAGSFQLKHFGNKKTQTLNELLDLWLFYLLRESQPLREDCFFPGKGHDPPAPADRGKKLLRVASRHLVDHFVWWRHKLSPCVELHFGMILAQNYDHQGCSLLHEIWVLIGK
jgi:hypothetical protein